VRRRQEGGVLRSRGVGRRQGGLRGGGARKRLSLRVERGRWIRGRRGGGC